MRTENFGLSLRLERYAQVYVDNFYRKQKNKSNNK